MPTPSSPRTPGQPIHHVEIGTIKQAVMAGLGIALISAHTVAAEVHDGRLVVLDVDGLPVRRHWLLVRMARRAAGPATRALWEFVTLSGAEHLPAWDG